MNHEIINFWRFLDISSVKKIHQISNQSLKKHSLNGSVYKKVYGWRTFYRSKYYLRFDKNHRSFPETGYTTLEYYI